MTRSSWHWFLVQSCPVSPGHFDSITFIKQTLKMRFCLLVFMRISECRIRKGWMLKFKKIKKLPCSQKILFLCLFWGSFWFKKDNGNTSAVSSDDAVLVSPKCTAAWLVVAANNKPVRKQNILQFHPRNFSHWIILHVLAWQDVRCCGVDLFWFRFGDLFFKLFDGNAPFFSTFKRLDGNQAVVSTWFHLQRSSMLVEDALFFCYYLLLPVSTYFRVVFVH